MLPHSGGRCKSKGDRRARPGKFYLAYLEGMDTPGAGGHHVRGICGPRGLCAPILTAPRQTALRCRSFPGLMTMRPAQRLQRYGCCGAAPAALCLSLGRAGPGRAGVPGQYRGKLTRGLCTRPCGSNQRRGHVGSGIAVYGLG